MNENDRYLVVGGTSGIGGHISDLLIGMDCVVDTPTVEDMNVVDPQSVDNFMAGNRYTHVVYSAGVNHLMPLGWIDNGHLEDTFDVNIMGFIRIMNAIVETRRASSAFGQPEWERVSVVAVVSDSATTAMRHSIAYASSKAALAHAVRCAARELAPWCRVNGVSPSIVAGTPMTVAVDRAVRHQRGWAEAEAREYEMSLVPMGRRCTLDEVADVVLSVLAGPEFLTGSIIPITGGK